MAAGVDRAGLFLELERHVATLLEKLGHAGAAVQLVLGGLVEVGAELRERLKLAIGREVEAQRAGLGLDGLRLGGTADARHGDADVDGGTLALEEQVRGQEDLTVGDGDHVGRDVGGDVAGLGLDDRQSRHGAAAVGLVHLHRALEQAAVQVEDVAGIRLASRRAVQRQGHLAVGDGLLGQVVVDDEHVATQVLGARRLAVLAGVDEVLAHRGAGHRRDVLQRGGIGRGGGHDDRVFHGAVLLEGLHHVGHRGGLLAHGDVDADHVLALLVDDRVDGDGGLARLAVADDELALAAADGDHRVDGDDARLHGLVHRLAVDDAGSLELDGAHALGLDGALAVDRHAQRIHDAPEEALARRHLHDAAGRTDLVVLSNSGDIAHQDGADLFLFEVLRKTVDGSAIGADELQEFARHGTLQSIDAGDTVAHLDDRAHVHRRSSRGLQAACAMLRR